MLLLAIGTGAMAWFVFLTVLRRLMGQPELISRAKIWVGVSMVLVSSLFALAFTFVLSIVDRQYFDANVFSVGFFLFLVLSFLTSVQCTRKVSI